MVCSVSFGVAEHHPFAARHQKTTDAFHVWSAENQICRSTASLKVKADMMRYGVRELEVSVLRGRPPCLEDGVGVSIFLWLGLGYIGLVLW